MSLFSRALLAPEVIQTSKMDCGPASLKCLLEGFGFDADYGRLREACQTDVDGTSVDVIEDVAAQLGLEAVQKVEPEDHLFLREATRLPVLVVLSIRGVGNHFVVIWRRHGALYQVMDPAFGRRWLTGEQIRLDLYRHAMRVPEAGLREWATSPDFQGPLERRLADLGLDARARAGLLAFASADASAARLGALDAATRMVAKLHGARALPRGQKLEPLIAGLTATTKDQGVIPEPFWSFWPVSPEERDPEGDPEAWLRGAVIVSLARRARETNAADAPREATTAIRPEVARALSTPARSPWSVLAQMTRVDGLHGPVVVAGALFVAGAAVSAQALVLRGFLELGRLLGTGPQRLGGMSAVLVLLVAILLIGGAVNAAVLRIGRRLEVRLRIALLHKIPRIADQFFQSRLVSDMAERAHAIANVRALPKLVFGMLSVLFQLLFTIAGLVWQQPSSAVAVLAVTTCAVSFGWVAHAWMTERDLRVRGFGATVARYYFDAFMGLWAIRAHGGTDAVMREQESHLVQWTDAQLRLQRVAVLVEGVQTSFGYGLAIWFLFHLRPGQEGTAILLAYWALQLPTLAQSLTALARQIPPQYNITQRVLEPLGTPEEAPASTEVASRELARSAKGVALSLRGVTVRAGGRALLEGLDLEVGSGEHVAIVGESGAGKSTLVGLLLGWHRVAAGGIFVDDAPLDGGRLAALRRRTAWIDPGVQIFNQRFIENLTYAAGAAVTTREIGWAVETAELRQVLERLPEGLQAALGEGGGRLSGGEGQRVRLARALLQRDVRLAILDEPFRGLDRQQRTDLLRRTRELWSDATMLCATHDVAETLSFDRVLVVAGGRVVEDENPSVLAARPGSLYARLLEAERTVVGRLWREGTWRRISVEGGRVRELPPAVDSSTQPVTAPRPRLPEAWLPRHADVDERRVLHG